MICYIKYSHKDTIMSSAMSHITGEDSRGARIPLTSISTSSDHIAQQNGSNPINTPHSNPGNLFYNLYFLNMYITIFIFFNREL